jgi:hypothetical protein
VEGDRRFAEAEPMSAIGFDADGVWTKADSVTLFDDFAFGP